MTANNKFYLALAYWIGYMIFMCFYFYFNKIDQYRHSTKTDGIVIDKLYGTTGGGRYGSGGFYYPQYQFMYHDSMYISADMGFLVRGKGRGDKVRVIFPDDQPEESVIYNFFSYWIILPRILLSLVVASSFFLIPFVAEQYRLFRKEYKGR